MDTVRLKASHYSWSWISLPFYTQADNYSNQARPLLFT